MKVLVCTDGSKLSNRAVEKTAKIAELVKDIHVTLIHVLQPLYAPPYGAAYDPIVVPPQLKEQIKEEGQNILQEAAGILKEHNVTHDALLLEGHTASTIIEQASKHEYDLLVIGSKGRTGLEKVLMGSVSSAVVQGADCDVLVVK